jgi:hypothetical protein
MIRAFDWRDVTTLHRNRKESLYLDTALALTGHMMPVPVSALISSVVPVTGSHTFVTTEKSDTGQRVIGQFSHPQDSLYAHLTFLSPEKAIPSSQAAALLDGLAYQAGMRGAHNLLADVNERSAAFKIMRRAGYAIYGRQRIWEIKRTLPEDENESGWSSAGGHDEAAVRSLYQTLVPGIVQQTEPPPWEALNGKVCYRNGDLLAFAQITAGAQGILIEPFMHPNIDSVSRHLSSLINAMDNRRDRPVYVVVRSHQAWIEFYLTELGAQAGPRQAIMVKRLILPRKIELPIKVPAAALETAQPEITSFRPAGNGHHVLSYDKTEHYG